MESILLFISGAEIVIVLVVILLLFGSKKIPELAQGLGKGMKEFKRAADDIKKEIKDETEILDNIKDFKDDINKKL
ncbi:MULTISPECIES: twin-arginine translocase TatA/TatE family subunit [Marinifilum]|jgi:sec-independent protein translocase protein TatA|uniref:Sec-independent protein translocase protein TatA n=2 Tax=Marinifilum TaxID=866673 RepID=A0A419WX43_9BACT|nr:MULTISPECIES: twin-arginine translocase TatA/TatE family subunit [Marinifilum]NOU61142.1 twin-arginine translocase TatA/TatE family subunit [Marinifilum caeruleilacunae]RKE00064.1 sec-independent protein translocase protein TatA [Marinifilum flexuosum]